MNNNKTLNKKNYKIGLFTGTVYPEDYDFKNNCIECCRNYLSEEKPSDEVVKGILLSSFIDCKMCNGCPASNTMQHGYYKYLSQDSNEIN